LCSGTPPLDLRFSFFGAPLAGAAGGAKNQKKKSANGSTNFGAARDGTSSIGLLYCARVASSIRRSVFGFNGAVTGGVGRLCRCCTQLNERSQVLLSWLRYHLPSLDAAWALASPFTAGSAVVSSDAPSAGAGVVFSTASVAASSRVGAGLEIEASVVSAICAVG
jgi:hypothetical protein